LKRTVFLLNVQALAPGSATGGISISPLLMALVHTQIMLVAVLTVIPCPTGGI